MWSKYGVISEREEVSKNFSTCINKEKHSTQDVENSLRLFRISAQEFNDNIIKLYVKGCLSSRRVNGSISFFRNRIAEMEDYLCAKKADFANFRVWIAMLKYFLRNAWWIVAKENEFEFPRNLTQLYDINNNYGAFLYSLTTHFFVDRCSPTSELLNINKIMYTYLYDPFEVDHYQKGTNAGETFASRPQQNMVTLYHLRQCCIYKLRQITYPIFSSRSSSSMIDS